MKILKIMFVLLIVLVIAGFSVSMLNQDKTTIDKEAAVLI